MPEFSQKAKDWMASIDPLDEYGFQVRQHHYWVPETAEQEIVRLTWNQLKYEQYMANGSTFPRSVSEARQAEFFRLRKLRETQE
ncbi:MAG: hypothetical protein E4H01_16900 [Lysobacterales bacterium]|nr:MAG: hypothetical protein E4H01_16900 [Xanthomonadales bacterium]